MFFDEEAGFDPPAMTSTEITALVHIIAVQGATRQPGMFGLTGN